MRNRALAVDCPAREPDPILLEQLTALACLSTAPPVKPWWQRLTVKTGAAAVAGVLVISGATADALHGQPQPLVTTIGVPAHAAPHHKAAKPATPSHSTVWSTRTLPMRHAGTHARHSGHKHGKKNKHGKSNGGATQNSQGSDQQQLSRLATPVQTTALPIAAGPSRGHGNGHQRSHSQH